MMMKKKTSIEQYKQKLTNNCTEISKFGRIGRMEVETVKKGGEANKKGMTNEEDEK